MIFLTDGANWLGPYDKENEPFAIARGNRELRENQGAGQVWSVEADDEAAAKEKYRTEIRKFESGG